MGSLLLACLPSAPAQSGPAHPHVVLFLVDDLGWQDTSVPLHSERTPFNDRYRTPAMERLAREGVVFTQAYAASPVCTPTRISLMTGQNPARHHTTNWILRPGQGPGAPHPTLTPPAWNHRGLGTDAVTLPRLLQQAGYRTIHVGKAHLGALDTPGADPRNLGFDVNVAGHAAGGPGSYRGEDHYSATRRAERPSADTTWDVPGLEKYHGTDVHLTDALTREALAAMAQALDDGRPFFLHLSHYAVHAPIMPDPRFTGGYPDLPPEERAYASLVEGVDRSLAAVLDFLDDRGIADQTLVLFFSDNGGLSAHARSGPPHVHNAPLQSGKGAAFEGGIRVPFLVRWPARIRAGRREPTPVISDDFLPTLLELTGVEPPADLPAQDGLSLAPLLLEQDGFPAARTLGWHYPHQWGAPGPGILPFSALRRGPWKLIWFHEESRVHLYHLEEDLGEAHDRAAAHPEVVAEMTRRLRDWLTERDAPLPTVTATGAVVALPDAH